MTEFTFVNHRIPKPELTLHQGLPMLYYEVSINNKQIEMLIYPISFRTPLPFLHLPEKILQDN